MTAHEETLSRIEQRAADRKTRTDHADVCSSELQPRLTDADVVEAECCLGFDLPPFLIRVYSQIANGGFGPGYGLLPLVILSSAESARTIVETYQEFSAQVPSDPEWQWPQSLLPICDWGCAIHSCIDCSTPSGLVVTCDPNQRTTHEPISKALAPTQYDIAGWLDAWARGVSLWDTMFEDSGDSQTIINPFTGESIEIRKLQLRR